MKRIISILVLIFSVIGYSQSPEELFVKGNELYKAEKYEEALQQYHLIEESQVVSADLYYNIANCYYKLNQVAPAIYYYEKTLKLKPTHADAKANIVFAKRMTLDVIEDLPKNIFETFSEKIIYQLNYNTWAVLAVVFSFLAALFFMLYHFSYASRAKLVFFNLSILVALLLITSTVFAYKVYDFEKNTIHAIVFKQTVEIQNAPTLSSDAIFQLHEGTKVQVLDKVDDWKKIRLSDGKTGWIIAANIKEL